MGASNGKAPRGSVTIADYPELLGQWHSERNGDLAPADVSRGSKKKIWWECDVAPDHVWNATAKSRTGRKTGCPACAGLQASTTNSIATIHPGIVSKWDQSRNGPLTPRDVVAKTEVQYWWKCDQGPDHEWQSAPTAVANLRDKCPFCSGRAVCPSNSLSASHPALAAQWHPNRNEIGPVEVRGGSKRSIWWICDEDEEHVWQANVSDRALKGAGCPYCSGRRASDTNSLAVLFPKIAAEWHPTKNGKQTPEDFTGSSNQKVWWKCPEGPDHEWTSTIDNRTLRESGCPCCVGRKASVTNNVQVQFPEIARQWHPTKNGSRIPDRLASGYRTKVWWTCPEGPEHDYKASPHSRTGEGTACPTCAGKRVSSTNSLAARCSHVAAQWHPSKNGETSPHDVVWATSKRYWWKCPKGPDHEWEAPVSRLTSTGQGCPFCRGMRPSVTNCISTVNPDVAAEWHPTRNAPLSPSNVVAGSNKSYWWRCRTNPDHEWEATANNRARNGLGSGCPHCAPPKDSWQQVCLSFEIRAFFDHDVDDHEVRVPGRKRSWNVDIVLRHERIAIEFDGRYWHGSAEAFERDRRKTLSLENDGWLVIRVREQPLVPIGAHDVVVPAKDAKAAAILTLVRLQQLTGYELSGLDDYRSTRELANGGDAIRYIRELRNRRTLPKTATG